MQDHPAYIPRAIPYLVGGTAAEPQIRRSGHIVQDRLLRSLRGAEIPQLSVWDAPCPAAWLQHWLQSWRPGTDSRLSAQAGHILGCLVMCERPCALPTADACRWLLLLLSRLLSTRLRPSFTELARTLQGMARARSGRAPAWPLVSGQRAIPGLSPARTLAPSAAIRASWR